MVDILFYVKLRNTEEDEPAVRFGPFDDVDIFRGVLYADVDDKAYELAYVVPKNEAWGILLGPDQEDPGTGDLWKASKPGMTQLKELGYLKSGTIYDHYLIGRVVSSDAVLQGDKQSRRFKRRTVLVGGKS